jgi:hypothetical protein
VLDNCFAMDGIVTFQRINVESVNPKYLVREWTRSIFWFRGVNSDRSTIKASLISRLSRSSRNFCSRIKNLTWYDR